MNDLREIAALPVRGGWSREDDFDFRHYIDVVDRKKWAILGLAGIVSLITLLVTLAITPVYQASATLLIESKSTNLVSIEEVYGFDTGARQYYETQFEILKSRPLAERVIRRLSLTENPVFAPQAVEGEEPGGLGRWLPFLGGSSTAAVEVDPVYELTTPYLKNLIIDPVKDTQLVHVRFESTDPALAEGVANAHAEAYIDSMLDARMEVTERAESWMRRRLDELRDNLQLSEERLQAFREQEQLVDVDGLQSLPAKEIDELTSRLIEVRRQVSQSKTAYMQVQQLRDAAVSVSELSSLPGVLNDSLVQTFRQATAEAEIQVAELAKRYGPRHPKMIAAESELAAANESLARHIGSVADSIRTRYEEAQQEEAAITEALDQAKGRYHVVGRKGSELRALQQEVESNRQLYDMFYNRVKETSQTDDMQPVNARIISDAIIPADPVKPNKRLFVALAFFLSLALGVVAAFLLDALDNTIKSAEDVEEKLDQSLLGMLPLVDIPEGREGVPLFVDGDQNGYAEAVRTVRTGIALSSLDEPYRTIMVTSSVANEGKTTTSINLALAFSKMERVLLVDADMRRPSVARELALPRARAGLAELVAGKARLEEAIVSMAGQNVDVIGAGVVPPNPLELLSSRRLRELLSALGERYDRVIIDCPPVLPVSDARVIATHVDSVVYVVKADATSAHKVTIGLGHLTQTRAPITGVVLNRLDVKKAEKYGDYGYGGYYESYDSQPA
ncbi:polysaccharide biosynthesis tyrosine autokinase [Parahaliea maris]|uniref:non-specific protein-tyrosine kinase n=1 Tax=Parahaliea maris TaxID=2716870 RepID=A0A5C8ZN34_9GAMM|nr:polysaccharide biosynthesis tyrosine autokinase [Parahaliea maris]TXS89903.1 polysaccharide biosynthesis tyrosine autokinase [Parahaliea maris]